MAANLEARPILVAIAGPNGAGKTTFYQAHIAAAGLRYLNADEIARELGIDSVEAAEVVAKLRDELCASGESFVFETVLSDPIGDKVDFLRRAAERGHTVLLCFVGLANAAMSDDRVAMRVAQGGHDVPQERIVARFPRVLKNLRRAVELLPHVIVYDNSDLARPFRLVAEIEHGKVVSGTPPWPAWFATVVGGARRGK